MFRVPLIVAFVLALAFGLGIGSTLLALKASSGFGAIRLGAWIAFPDQQRTEADPYARSHRAYAGRLLYGIGEGLTFQAGVDDEGDRLSPRCTYEMSGQTPIARFFTLFAANDALEPLSAGPGLPSAFNSWNVLRRPDGSFSVTISRRAQPGNWLAIRSERPFKLVMTLLDTPTAGSSGVIDLAMPSLKKIGCDDA